MRAPQGGPKYRSVFWTELRNGLTVLVWAINFDVSQPLDSLTRRVGLSVLMFAVPVI
jgi:hypothetical protein